MQCIVKPRSKPHPGHSVFPYLLRDARITKANQVRAADITCIPMAKGVCYLVVIMEGIKALVEGPRTRFTLVPSTKLLIAA